MSDLMGKRLLLFFIAFFLPMAVFSIPAQAEDGPLQVATETHVADDGTVRVHLTLKNASRNPLFNIIPTLRIGLIFQRSLRAVSGQWPKSPEHFTVRFKPLPILWTIPFGG